MYEQANMLKFQNEVIQSLAALIDKLTDRLIPYIEDEGYLEYLKEQYTEGTE